MEETDKMTQKPPMGYQEAGVAPFLPDYIYLISDARIDELQAQGLKRRALRSSAAQREAANKAIDELGVMMSLWVIEDVRMWLWVEFARLRLIKLILSMKNTL